MSKTSKTALSKKSAARKLANDTAIWFFDQLDEQNIDIGQFLKSADGWVQEANGAGEAKLSPDMWAELLATAISAFNEGLDEYINLDERDTRRASKDADVNNYRAAVNLVGREAFQVIAFLVAAQDMRRPVDPYAQASTLYTDAMSDLSNYNKLFNTTKQLQELSKTPGMDPNNAKQIGSMAAELQQHADKATAYGTQDTSQQQQPGALPTGVTFQGSKRPRA